MINKLIKIRNVRTKFNKGWEQVEDGVHML